MTSKTSSKKKTLEQQTPKSRQNPNHNTYKNTYIKNCCSKASSILEL